VNSGNSRRCSFCTDDRQSEDILKEGHIDHILRRAVSSGMDAIRAIQMATINAAEAYGLRGKGGIGVGWDADLAVVEDIANFSVLQTWAAGKLVAESGEAKFRSGEKAAEYRRKSMNIKSISAKSFALPLKNDHARVIHIHPGSLITEQAVRRVHRDSSGNFLPEDPVDICKLAVIERHHATGNIGLGLVEGYGIRSGAVATTIAHDSHNLLVIGRNDEDMLAAAEELMACGGGITIVKSGKVLGTLPLPVGGLMSEKPAAEVSEKLAVLSEKARRDLGISGDIDPFMTLSFLALPVIPSIKLTDQGLFDVERFEHIDINP
jgi:adenine deaminase